MHSRISVLLASLAFCLMLPSYSVAAAVAVGKPVPDSRFGTVEGNRLSLDDLTIQGDDAAVLILSFFNTSCVTCPAEIEKLQTLYDRYKDDKVVIRIVSVEEKEDDIRKYLENRKFRIPALLDKAGLEAEKYGVKIGSMIKVPQLFVISKNKTLVLHSKHYEENIVEQIEKVLPGLLAEQYVGVKERKISILYTNSANAWFESCDCPQHPYGGMVRRAYYIKKNRASNTILLDSGDNFTPYNEKLKNETVLKIMKLLNYDLIVMGDQEFALGKDYWLEANGKEPYGTLPFNTGNLTLKAADGTEVNMGTEYVIRQAGAFKIAILGVISPKVFMFYPKDRKEGILIKETPKEFLTRVLPKLRGEHKDLSLVVVVSHSGEDEDVKLASEVPGIDVIVGGHSQSRTDRRVKNTWLVQSGENAQCVGKLTVEFTREGKIKTVENNLVQLTRDYRDDPEVRAVIDRFKEEYRESLKKIKF